MSYQPFLTINTWKALERTHIKLLYSLHCYNQTIKCSETDLKGCTAVRAIVMVLGPALRWKMDVLTCGGSFVSKAFLLDNEM